MTASSPDRRTVIRGAAAAIATLSWHAKATERVRRFPKHFIWGAATAAHQVEGNNVNSDWWLLENVPSTLAGEPSLDACDHYRRFASDIALLANLGLGSYRFSVEWARVEPEKGRFSASALDHYREVLQAC